MTRIGTHHFVSIASAVRYYKPYGFDRTEIERKIAENEIAIGMPPLKPGQRCILIDFATRYAIEEATS